MTRERRDVVVIGGGPAGSTFASIVRKYSPDVTVTLLEKHRFPRWHIGESTIPVANSVLRDLGVFDELEQDPTIVKKMGVTYIWGRDRQPWSADYLKLRDARSVTGNDAVIDVCGQDFSELMRRAEFRETPFLAFHVRRDEFDDRLLRRSRELGADVREGTWATQVERDGAGKVVAVHWADDEGREGVIETPFVLDASGQMHFLTHRERVYDPTMNNFAVFGYLRNAGWKVVFNGTRERTSAFISAVEKGWIWYFPIAQDVMSVGAVTRTDHFKDRLKNLDLESFFWEMMRACPEVKDLVKDAELRDDILPKNQRVAAIRDWSSWTPHPVGPGWAAAGDAAVFVDPILSTGVTIALQSAHRAAYTYNTARARPDLPADALWSAYADYLREEASAFLTMARYFYGNNRAAESWWWEAHRILNTRGQLDLADKQIAFTLATAGFFPRMRSLSSETIAPLLAHISAGDVAVSDVVGVFHEDGVPAADALAGRRYAVEAPFRLALRSQPEAVQGQPTGRLDTHYDVISDDPRFLHRNAGAPSRIAAALAPVVEAIPRHTAVDDLLADARGLLGDAAPDEQRRAVLALLRVTALKGFVRVEV
jgi:clorobiocin biosynthesis protein Clo-hal